MVTDIPNARRNVGERQDLRDYLAPGEHARDADVGRRPVVRKASVINTGAERLLDRLATRLLEVSRLGNGIAGIYGSDLSEKLDYLAVDFYDPFAWNLIK